MEADESVSLDEKLDRLTSALAEVQPGLEAVRELMDDAMPVVNQAVKLSVDQMAEVGDEFDLADLAYLVKHALRDTRTLIQLLDQLESLADLIGDLEKVSKTAVGQITQGLGRLEDAGTFDTLRAGAGVAGRLAHEINPQDVEAAGDRLVAALQSEVPEKVSLRRLWAALGDQQVRRGLLRALNLVKVIGA
jgi:uncharacterized protein YjgD (DUF1641 family)